MKNIIWLFLSLLCFAASGLVFSLYAGLDDSLMIGLVSVGCGLACLIVFFAKRRDPYSTKGMRVTGKHWAIVAVTFIIVFSATYIYPNFIQSSPEELSRKYIENRYGDTAKVEYDKSADKYTVIFTDEELKDYVTDVADLATKTDLTQWDVITSKTKDIAFNTNDIYDIDIELCIINPLTKKEIFTAKNAEVTFDIAVGLRLSSQESEDKSKEIIAILKENLSKEAPCDVKYDEASKVYTIILDQQESFLALTLALIAKEEDSIDQAHEKWNEIKAGFEDISAKIAKIDGTGNLAIKSPVNENILLVVSNGVVAVDAFQE